MGEPGYTIGDHPSDLELTVRGRTLKELFAEAARAILDYTASPPGSGPVLLRSVSLTAADREELLVLWLNEIVYLLETGLRPLLPVEISRLTARGLRAEVKGRRLDPAASFSGPEIKAATYHQLSIRRSGKLWEARVILDL